MEAEEQLTTVSLHIHHNGSPVTLDIPTTTKVSVLKGMICGRLGMPIGNCEIIFCGHEMKDNLSLETYDITSSTTLHFVLKEKHDNYAQLTAHRTTGTSKVSYLTGIWMHRLSDSVISYQTRHDPDTPKEIWPMFYAYCKQCSQVVSSKLRVRCCICKQDTLTLHRDPEGWTDVTSSNQIMGCCNSVKCAGDACYAEFYFKCSSCFEDLRVIPLPNVRSNCEKSLCLTCLESDHPVITFLCHNDHVMCLSCFEQYVRTNLRERNMICHEKAGYTLPCPEGCADSCLLDTHVFHILGPDEYQVYQSYAAEECLILNMQGAICPNPRCGTGLFPLNDHQMRLKVKVQCPVCKHEFCSVCKEAYHGSDVCGTYQQGCVNSKMTQEYFASIQTIKLISKKCPQCSTSTERNGGCMHMTCSLCRFEWCWHCVTAWNPDCQMDHWFE